MMKLKFFVLISGLLSLMSCGVPKVDYDKLLEENKILKTEIDELKNGEPRLVAIADKAFEEKRYDEVKSNVATLIEKHPDSKEIDRLKSVLKKVEKIQLVEHEKKAAEDKERIRLENLNNTGIWENTFYVDKFGEETKERVIRNSSMIGGKFSNTATEDSDLNVRFLIDGSSKISIMLYEYAGNNPVKAYSSTHYSVAVKDKDGKKYETSAVNYGDRLTFDSSESRTIHKVLMKGRQVQFWIQETETPTTKYQFTIPNVDWYENAYQKLIAK